MANLYSVLPGLTPSSQEILEAELLAKQVLEGKYPDLDLREGTGLRDLVLRPTAYAFALLKKATDYYLSQNTISTVDDSTPTEVVDDLLSNWFMTRNTGTKAVISSRLYFARAKNVTITSDIGFSPDNKVYFFPESSQAYTTDAMSYDAYSNEWYIDVPLVAADTGVEYNLSEGSLLYFSTFDPYFLRAEINYLISESSPAETNTEFIKRTSSAISTRNLINIPSIESRLLQTFNYIDDVAIVGAGDPDMVRDMIRVYPKEGSAVVPTGADVSGTLVTFNIDNHVYQAGQSLVLSKATPDTYNGRFTVTTTDVGRITLYIPNNPGYISTMPEIRQDFSPVYIHNGGSVDVYCGKRLGTYIVQLTTDNQGVAEVYGPVYSLKRSLVSGGDVEDDIPVVVPVLLTDYEFLASSKQLSLTTAQSTLTTASALRLYGVEQYQAIASISCNGNIVTAVTGSHSLSEGDTVRIQGVSPGAYNGSYTVAYVTPVSFAYYVPSQISGPGSGDMRVYNTYLLKDVFVQEVSGIQATVRLPNIWSVETPIIEGTLLAEVDTPYTVIPASNRDPQEVLVSVRKGQATVSLFNHGVSSGRRVTLSNSSNHSLNGTWRVSSVINGSQFVLDMSSASVADISNASSSMTYLTNSMDFGFSSRQQLSIDFGNSYANSKVSFELSSFRDVSDVQSYLESPDNRVICGDYLARGFNITILDVELVTYNPRPFDGSLVQYAVEDYLSSLTAGSTFVLSDLVSSLYKRGITNIKTPVGVKYTRYTRDLTTPETGEILDYLDPADKTNIFLLKGVVSTATST